MALRRSLGLLLLATVASGGVPVAVRAGGLSVLMPGVNVDATVGLDRPTRQLIERMPAEIRKQTLQLLKEAQPLIDQSVNSYLERINQIVDAQIDHAACAVTGTAANIGTMFKHAIVGGRPEIVASIESDWEALAGSFNGGTAPRRYVTVYADFLVNATVASCQVATTPEARQLVDRVRQEARRAWTAWSRLEGQCMDATECLSKVRQRTVLLVEQADSRDLQAADAVTRFDRITPMPRRGLFESFAPRPYEDRLSRLFEINDAVEIAKTVREAQAHASLAKMKGLVEQSERWVNEAAAKLNRRRSKPNVQALDLVASASRADKDIQVAGAQAVELLQSLASQTAALEARQQTSVKRRTEIQARAEANLLAIAVREAVNQRDFQRRH